jgi:hypothetical protein
VITAVASRFKLHVPYMVLLARQWTATSMIRRKDKCLGLGPAEVSLADASHVLQHIQQVAFVAPLDKAGNQPYYICLHLAHMLAYEQVHTASYTPVNPCPLVQVQAVLPAAVRAMRIVATERHATLFPIYKAHKQKYRFITTAAKTTLSSVGELVSSVTRVALETMQHVAGSRNATAWNMHQVKVQYYSIIKDAREMLCNLPPAGQVRCDFSCDVESCYDAIPTGDAAGQDGLLPALKQVLKMCTQWYRSQNSGKQPLFWVKQHATTQEWLDAKFQHTKVPHRQPVTCEEVLELVAVLLQHSVLQVGKETYRQVNGIPQGISPGPDLANLYLLCREFMYLDRQLQQPAGREQLKVHSLQWWYRFIDDVRILNNRKAAEVMRGVLPGCMNCENTTEHLPDRPDVLSVTSMLNVRSTLFEGGVLLSDVIHKEAKLPLAVVQYVHLHSNRPLNTCYSTVCALTLNALWICTHGKDFENQLHCLLHRYQSLGYDGRRLQARMLAVVEKYSGTLVHKQFDAVRVVKLLKPKR